MADDKKQKASSEPKDVLDAVRKSVSRMHEIERRMQHVQTEISTLAGLVSGRPQVPVAGAAFQGFSSEGPLGLVQQTQPMVQEAFAYAPRTAAPTNGFGQTHASPALFGNPRAQGELPTTRELARLPPMPRTPEAVVIDTDDTFVIRIDLPGVQKNDLDLRVSEHSVTVSAEAPAASEEGVLLVVERGPVKYRRTIQLPTACDTDATDAKLKDGVLTLRLPKAEVGDGSRRVDVAYG